MGIFSTLRRVIAPSPVDQAVKIVRGLLLSDIGSAEYLAKAARVFNTFAANHHACQRHFGHIDAFATEADANAALEWLLGELLHDQHLHDLGLGR
jgi:hypothetical protein